MSFESRQVSPTALIANSKQLIKFRRRGVRAGFSLPWLAARATPSEEPLPSERKPEAVTTAFFTSSKGDPMPLDWQFPLAPFHQPSQAQGGAPAYSRPLTGQQLADDGYPDDWYVPLATKDYQTIESVLSRIMELGCERGNIDTGIMRDFFDRLPPGTIDPELARQYDEHSRIGAVNLRR